jgi:2-polyprenyl-6-methoxyphenol hydroxylase-like FAD-dependent oxidoreductase
MALEQLPSSTTVLIVGGGPIGLLTSILLNRQGIDTVVVERRHDVQVAPAAHVVNARTFEIMRAAGVDMARIDAASGSPSDSGVRWVTRITGDELGSVPFERQHRFDELYDVTPTPLRNLSQHRLEPILRDHVPTLSLDTEWVGAQHTGSTVISTLRDAATGDTRDITSSYLIAADGAASPVRRSLGIELVGPQRLQAFLTIHVEVDLRHLVADRPATLYWMVDPDIGGTYIAHDIDGTWVFMHPWNPDIEQLADYTDERCAELFRRGIGTDIGPVTIRSITPWNMSCQVAERYRQGRVFLVGDAAHRFPPTGGMGLNTGATEAQNLAWKLAAVQHGWADERVLDTYHAERHRLAEINSQQSLNNAMKLFEVAIALGVDADPEVSRANYAAVISTPEGRAAVQAATDGQAEHFDMLGLQLGFSYTAEAGLVVDDGAPPVVAADIVRDYLPSTHPGARLPHAWVEREGQRVSTLDLVPLDRFVLLTSSPAWAAAGEQLVGGEVPIDVVLVGRDVLDIDSNWARAGQLASDAAVLVRPDQHIGWRATTVDDDLVVTLREALAVLTGHRLTA